MQPPPASATGTPHPHAGLLLELTMHPLCALAASGQISPVPLSAPLSTKDKRTGIYCIWMPDDPKHRVYVGQTGRGVGRRISAHRAELRNGKHCSPKFRLAYHKYGEGAWRWALVEEAPADAATLTAAEQAWMDAVGRERQYNTAPAAGSRLGYRAPPGAAPRSGRGGKANAGRVLTPQHKARIGAANTGKARSPEHRAKLREALLGRTLSSQTRDKMRAAQLGRPKSPEAVAKGVATRRANATAKLAAAQA